MPPTGDAYNVDWVFASACNVHVATHRDWFINYTVFPSKLINSWSDAPGSPGMTVLGVGDVLLPVRKSLEFDDERGNGTILLEDVLYVPDGMVNIFGHPVLYKNGYQTSFGAQGEIMKDGETIAIMPSEPLYRILLSGQSVNHSSLDRNRKYAIRVEWPEEELRRWEAYKASSGTRNAGQA